MESKITERLGKPNRKIKHVSSCMIYHKIVNAQLILMDSKEKYKLQTQSEIDEIDDV